PLFEEMLVRSGIILVKYWFSVNDEEQEKRFQDRMRNPIKRWKLSAMDIESRRHWVDYSQAKDLMFARTDTKVSPWYVVNSDNKKQARLNCITHLLSRVDYKDLNPVEIALPPRQSDSYYKRPKITSQRFVLDIYGRLRTWIDEFGQTARRMEPSKRSTGARYEIAHRSRHQGFAG